MCGVFWLTQPGTDERLLIFETQPDQYGFG